MDHKAFSLRLVLMILHKMNHLKTTSAWAAQILFSLRFDSNPNYMQLSFLLGRFLVGIIVVTLLYVCVGLLKISSLKGFSSLSVINQHITLWIQGLMNSLYSQPFAHYNTQPVNLQGTQQQPQGQGQPQQGQSSQNQKLHFNG